MPAITYTGDLQMTHPSTAATRLKYGDHRIVILPNPFESRPIEDAIAVIGDQRLAELKTKANSRNWTPKRLEAEIRCIADEVHAREQS